MWRAKAIWQSTRPTAPGSSMMPSQRKRLCGYGFLPAEKTPACDNAYVSHGSVLSNHARAEDDAYLRGAVMNGSARVSGCARSSACRVSSERPLLSGHCQVYGSVRGDVRVTGTAVILPGEEILNDTKDTFVLTDTGRSVIRGRDRECLASSQTPPAKEKKPKKWGMER